MMNVSAFDAKLLTRVRRTHTMSTRFRFLLLSTFLFLLLGLLASSEVALGQGNYPLENCLIGAFSTEEDFMMMEGEPYDGNPYISDGDLLNFNGQLCARNADLLAAFRPVADLGLDAVHIIDVTDRLVAFSTELDDPRGQFSAGDLLFTNGAVIPNSALVSSFGIQYDIGLDAVQLLGERENILSFIGSIIDVPPDQWQQGFLQDQLKRHKVDLWFSIEGTQSLPGAAPILDGDLLSASGVIVAPNSVLLPASVPAGIPQRGVDFGLDAVNAVRVAGDDIQGAILFSTEILYNGELGFSDGDVLLGGNGIAINHEDLIRPFHPRADFLGLDALWMGSPEPIPEDPFITHMCGDYSVGDFDGGLVPVGGGGTGLYRDNPDLTWPDGRPHRPCGRFVPIDGFLPAGNVNRFRVAYRPAGDPAPAPGAADGMRTAWKIYRRQPFWPFACQATGDLSTDAQGWMDAALYRDYKTGAHVYTGGCPNSGLRLAVWNSAGLSGYEPGPANPNGHYVLWLEWEDGGGFLHREPVEHHLQLDNTKPEIKEFKVTLADGTTPLPACGEAPNGASTFKVYADFKDDYYWGYELVLSGGNPPKTIYYGFDTALGQRFYYSGTPEVANTDTGGSTGATVFLRDIHMTDLGASFQDCCYLLRLNVKDSAIRHGFNRRIATDNSGSSGYWDSVFITFAAAP